MGDTLWVDVRDRTEGDQPRDHSIILRLTGSLDRLASQLKVRKLSEFYDYSEMEAAYGDFGEGENEAEVPPAPEGVWYDPAPALAAVRAIHALVVEHPADFGFTADPSRAHWQVGLRDELADCLLTLERVVERGQQFRFLIVP